MSKVGTMAALGIALMAVLVAAGPGVAAAESAEKSPHTAVLEHSTTIDISYPVTGTSEVDDIIRTWLEKNSKDLLSSYVGVSLDPDIAESSDTLSITYRKSRPSERVVSYIFDTYASPWRAAHPMAYVSVLSIDLDAKKQLKLADIFAKPDRALELFKEKSPALVMKDLAERMPGHFDGGVPETYFFNEGFDATPENYQALVLEPDGVRIIFSLYQILPYVFGMTEAFIPLDQLDEAGPNPALWEK